MSVRQVWSRARRASGTQEETDAMLVRLARKSKVHEIPRAESFELQGSVITQIHTHMVRVCTRCGTTGETVVFHATCQSGCGLCKGCVTEWGKQDPGQQTCIACATDAAPGQPYRIDVSDRFAAESPPKTVRVCTTCNATMPIETAEEIMAFKAHLASHPLKVGMRCAGSLQSTFEPLCPTHLWECTHCLRVVISSVCKRMDRMKRDLLRHEVRDDAPAVAQLFPEDEEEEDEEGDEDEDEDEEDAEEMPRPSKTTKKMKKKKKPTKKRKSSSSSGARKTKRPRAVHEPERDDANETPTAEDTAFVVGSYDYGDKPYKPSHRELAELESSSDSDLEGVAEDPLDPVEEMQGPRRTRRHAGKAAKQRAAAAAHADAVDKVKRNRDIARKEVEKATTAPKPPPSHGRVQWVWGVLSHTMDPGLNDAKNVVMNAGMVHRPLRDAVTDWARVANLQHLLGDDADSLRWKQDAMPLVLVTPDDALAGTAYVPPVRHLDAITGFTYRPPRRADKWRVQSIVYPEPPLMDIVAQLFPLLKRTNGNEEPTELWICRSPTETIPPGVRLAPINIATRNPKTKELMFIGHVCARV